MWPKGRERREDISGKRYGRLTVLSFSGKDKKGQVLWICRCDCGEEIKVKSGNLKNGHTQSCGCYMRERSLLVNKTHGQFCNGKQTRLYAIWAGIKRRCLNPNVKIFKYYGSRGITNCSDWMDFEPFYQWAMQNGYSDDLTIDRINNDGNYEPVNCRWITRSENCRRHALSQPRKDNKFLGRNSDERRMKETVQMATGIPTEIC
jgi:hypothetical protein